MAFGNNTSSGTGPAVALTGLLMALRKFLRNGTTGNREALVRALDIYDNGEALPVRSGRSTSVGQPRRERAAPVDLQVEDFVPGRDGEPALVTKAGESDTSNTQDRAL